MNTLVIFMCACAFAHAQFNNQYQSAQSSASFGGSRYQQASRGPAQASRGPAQASRGPAQTSQASQAEYQASQAGRVSQGCREKNERYPVSGSCDRYVECINGTAEERLCPDGLRFNPEVTFNVYPCQYPNDVPCLERSALQPAQPTENCPNQFGYYRLGDERNCSSYRSCVNGVAYDFSCPEGLAYSPSSYRCEWPDEVAECDAEAFLGFRCPAVPESRELGPPAGFRFYNSADDCQKYFICINDRPRVLRCGGYSAFDELTSACVSADDVAACPQQLRAEARRVRDEEQQRLAKQLEYDSKPQHSKRRF